MSQVAILSIASSPPPPDVPTDFGTDFDSDGNPPGNATPSNNKLYIVGTNGIVTETETTDASNDTVLIRFANGSTTTSDGAGQTQTILSFATDTDSCFTIQAMFAAFEPSTGSAFGGRLLVVCKNNAGVVTIATEIENIGGSDDVLISTCSFNAVGSGANLNLTVTGVATHTINWSVITPGIVGVS